MKYSKLSKNKYKLNKLLYYIKDIKILTIILFFIIITTFYFTNPCNIDNTNIHTKKFCSIVNSVNFLGLNVLVIKNDESIDINTASLQNHIKNEFSSFKIFGNIDLKSLEDALLKYNTDLVVVKFERAKLNKLVILVDKREFGFSVNAKNGEFVISTDGFVLDEKNTKNNTVSNINYDSELVKGEYVNDLLVTALNYTILKTQVNVSTEEINTVLKNSNDVLIRLPSDKLLSLEAPKIIDYLENNINLIEEQNIKEIDLRYKKVILRS